MVTVSVPGKVHLMGEHAVVYGRPALLAAINLRLYLSVEDVSRSSKLDTRSSNIVINSSEPGDYVRHAVEKVLDYLKIGSLPPVKITVKSDIPAGYHLGSSAAVAVATVGAVTYFLKKAWNPQAINQLAYDVEKKMHSNPSGGDNTTVTFGGFIWFRKELEFLKSIWQLPFKLHPSLKHFFLIKTKRPSETTGEMVALVRERYERQKSKMEKLLNQNEQQVKRVTVALKEGNEVELIDAIRVGEQTLEGMGVVSRKVIPLIRDIEKSGGAAKILGGGGREEGVGFLLCYHHDLQKVGVLSKPFGFTTQSISLGEEGVRLQK